MTSPLVVIFVLVHNKSTLVDISATDQRMKIAPIYLFQVTISSAEILAVLDIILCGPAIVLAANITFYIVHAQGLCMESVTSEIF
jgi:hypothetical protein